MLGTVQAFIFFALALVLFGIEVWAVIDAARRPAAAFLAAGKRTKNFWLVLVGIAAVIGFLTVPWPGGTSYFGTFFMFLAVIPAGIYLADVRPAVSGYSGRRPRGGGW